MKTPLVPPANTRFAVAPGQTLMDQKYGSAMHSRLGAWQEAQILYVRRALLNDRLDRTRQINQPLRILDVGLGIAANPLAFWEEWQSLAPDQPKPNLEIVSLETAPEGLATALSRPQEFDFVARNAGILASLLTHRIVEKKGLRWKLLIQDVTQALENPAALGRFDLILFDLYDPGHHPEGWHYSLLCKIPLLLEPQTGLFLTYVSATRVRTALLMAGLCVASAPASTVKKEMTLAFGPGFLPRFLPPDAKILDAEFVDHCRRSSRPWPDDFISGEWSRLTLALDSIKKSKELA